MAQGSVGAGGLKKASGKITLAAHCTAHNDVAVNYLVEEDVFVEGAEHKEKAPFAKALVFKAAKWTQMRMSFKQAAGFF